MGKGEKVHEKERKATKKSGQQRAPTFSGYNLFTEEFFIEEGDKNKEKHKGKHKEKGKAKSFKDVNLEVRQAWNKLSEKKKEEYSKRAEKLRAPGPGKGYVVPFLTRCAPNKFINVCNKLKERSDAMRRLKRIGFDKLVTISCRQINRDLCAEFMRCFDPLQSKCVLEVRPGE